MSDDRTQYEIDQDGKFALTVMAFLLLATGLIGWLCGRSQP